MARKKYYRNNDEDFFAGLIVLFVFGLIYSFITKYWLIILIILSIVLLYFLIIYIIDLDLFSKLKKPILYYKGKSNDNNLDNLKLDEVTNGYKINCLQKGMIGEERLNYNLINSRIPMYILHDLMLTCDNKTAQIDFILVTKRNMYILESKNLNGNVDIEKDGTFTRRMGMYKKGIKNPLTQNAEHENILNEILKKEKMKLKYESLVVLTNDNTYLNFKKSDKDYKNLIIRNDKIVEVLLKKEKKKHIIRDEEKIKKICDKLLKYEKYSFDVEQLKIRLKQYRKEKSNYEQIQPYMIFNDQTLDDLIKKIPQSLEELKLISGFGEYKVNKYGSEIVNIIKNEVNK